MGLSVKIQKPCRCLCCGKEFPTGTFMEQACFTDMDVRYICENCQISIEEFQEEYQYYEDIEEDI